MNCPGVAVGVRVTVCEFALPNENELAGNVLNPPVVCHPDIHSLQPIQAGLESAPELDIVPSRRRWTVHDAQAHAWWKGNPEPNHRGPGRVSPFQKGTNTRSTLNPLPFRMARPMNSGIFSGLRGRV